MPNRKHYRVCRVYRRGRPRLTSPKHHHLFSVSLFFISTSPGLTFAKGLFCFLWASLTLCGVFPTLLTASEGQLISWQWLIRHSPSSPLTPFIPSSCQLKRIQSGVVFLGFSSAKRRRARLARSCQSSSELTSRAGLEQINRTKLIIDFNHY